jgi:PilZ domain-containing protein
METLARRLEERIPLKVRVDLSSLDIRKRTQEGITENVSRHGARVISSKPWQQNERLNVQSFPGDFRARARVVYCIPLATDSFAIGLRLLAAAGNWK